MCSVCVEKDLFEFQSTNVDQIRLNCSKLLLVLLNKLPYHTSSASWACVIPRDITLRVTTRLCLFLFYFLFIIFFCLSAWHRRQWMYISRLPLEVGDRRCLSVLSFHPLLDIICYAFDTIVSAVRAVIQSLGIHGRPQLYNFVPPCKFLTGEYYTIILLHQLKKAGSPVS